MNVFRTGTIRKSVKDLDDRRLIKQILECKTIINVSEGATGYANHPVVKYYSQFPAWVAHYAIACCAEYTYRFGKGHSLRGFFIGRTKLFFKIPKVFYCEGSKTSPNAIRCYKTAESIRLFKQKLCKKWHEEFQKKAGPRWTKRLTPKFYNEYTHQFLEDMKKEEERSFFDD